MPTPYDGKIYLVQVKGSFLPRKSIGDVSRLIIDTMPNVDGTFLQTSQGKEWQGQFDNDSKAVTGSDAIKQWVSAMDSRGLETHVWGIPHGLNVQEEADKFIQAAKVPGVKSLGLDVEHGDFYYRGTAEAAKQMMTLIRSALGWDYHIALILDARRNRPFDIFVDPWLSFVNSVHPMVYPKDFGKPVEAALDAAFGLLTPYGKPVVPMLQSYNGIASSEITKQGDESFKRGAAAISFFCLGDKHMKEADFAAVAAVQSPGKAKRPAPEMLTPGAVGCWPDDPRSYLEHVYERSAARPWHDFNDMYGRGARWKLTSPANDVAVTYTPQLPAPGRYSVDIFITRENAESARADYHVVYYEGGQQKERQVKIDQSARSDEWVSLGVFDLDPNRPGDGRVNVTDFSDEQPSQPVSFAGVRWVPVAAAAAQPVSEVQRLAQERQRLTLAPVSTPVPMPAPAPTTLAITNQDAINAFIVAASKFGEKFTDWIRLAGVESIYENRKAAYSGPSPAALTNFSPDRKAALTDALSMPTADLARAAAASKPAKGKVDGRTHGVHGSAGFGTPPKDMWNFWIQEFKDMGLKWYKQCDNSGSDYNDVSCFKWVLGLRDAGITPVIRYQQSEMWPGNGLDNSFWEKMKAYVKEGIVWAEIGNEPNLPWEWKSEHRSALTWNNPDVIRVIAETWLSDAEKALALGARPAFYAMAPTDWRGGVHPNCSMPKFHENIWNYVGTHAPNRARNIFRSGGWLAVHAAVFEQPIDFDPFGSGPDWDMCLRGYEVAAKYIERNLGLKAGVDFPLMSTEGGVFTVDSTSMNGHDRLPSEEAHSDLMIKMFDWLEENSPMQAMMPWCICVDERIGHKPEEYVHDGWYAVQGGQFGPRPVVAKMKQVKKERGW